MSFAQMALAEASIAQVDDTQSAAAKKVPPKRQLQAVADTSATPEPR